MTKKQLIISVIILSFLGILFIWFQLRPSFIRSSCMQSANEICEKVGAPNLVCQTSEKIQKVYTSCLHSQGL